jgi:hypothetical protein
MYHFLRPCMTLHDLAEALSNRLGIMANGQLLTARRPRSPNSLNHGHGFWMRESLQGRWCFCWALSEHVRTCLYLSGSGFCGSHWKWSDYSLGLTRDLLWRHTEKKVSLLVALIVSITFHYTRSCEAISIAWANMSDDVRCYISEELLATYSIAFRMNRCSGGHCATDQSQTWQLPWVDVATTSWNRGPVAVQKCKKRIEQ